MNLFAALDEINKRPEPFQFYTARDLWTDEHTSEKMLSFHLDEDIDVSSRKAKFINESVEWICSRFRVGRDTTIADFGCGPGLYALRLAKRRGAVTGIDFSMRSLDYAKEAAAAARLDIDYVNADYLEYETEKRFDLILMIMCDFCALSPAQRKMLLAKFRKLLKPSGAVLLDVYSLEAFAQRKEQALYEPNLLDGFWSPNKYYGFLNAFKYDEAKVTLDKYTIIEQERIRTVYNWLQYFTPESLEREFALGGLSIAEKYANVAGAPYEPQSGEFAVVAGPK